MVDEFEISSEEGLFPAFRLKVVKGKVIECSDNSHPYGADWKTLKEYYDTRQYKCLVKKLSEVV
jgi:hypothetical protein